MKKIEPVIFAMPNVKKLGTKVAKKLKLPLSAVESKRFADGEMLVLSKRTVRNRDVFIIATTSKPVNDSTMELLIFIDALKRAGAKTINVVLTYYGYSRQDRKTGAHQPITAKLVANLLEAVGVHKIISIELHNPSINGFFNIPIDEIRGEYIIAQTVKKMGDFTVVSPDHGGATRARDLANLISKSSDNIAIIDKRRTGPNQAQIMGVLGDVKGKDVVIFDDMIDTGGTIIKAAAAMKNAGAKKVCIAAIHGLFSKGFDMFDKSKDVDTVLIADTVESVHDIKSKKLKIISTADLIAKTINATINSSSVGLIYKKVRDNLR